MATVDEDQQQQKVAEEEEEEEENAAEPSNDAVAAVAELNGSRETNNNEQQQQQQEEDLNLLLNPFTKEQLHDIVKQILKNQPSNFVYNLFGANLEEEEEEVEDLDLQDERLEKFLEPFTKEDLQDIVIDADPSLTENFRMVAGKVADVNPAHKKILVQVHGFRWDATDETLISVFRKYGEIGEIEVCKHVTDILQDYAFVSFKNRTGVREALKQPLKKIGNRWAVCKLAADISNACNVYWPLPFFNSLDHSKKALEDLHKVVDGPKGNKGCQLEHGLNLVPEECFNPAQRKDMYTYRELQLQSLLRWLGGCTENRDMPEIRVTYCNQAAMNNGNQPRMQ